jgi:hypothetical protein
MSMFKFECVGSLNLKNVGDFLTYKVTMLEDNNKLIEDKGLLKALLIYFLFSLCVIFIIYLFYVLKKKLFCVLSYCWWVSSRAKVHMGC